MSTIALADEILDTDTIEATFGELRVMAMRLTNQTSKARMEHGNKDGFTWDWTVARTIDLAKFYRTATLGIVDQWAGQVPLEHGHRFWTLIAEVDRAAIESFKAVYA